MLFRIKKTDSKNYLIDGNPYFITGLIGFVITFLLGLIFTRPFDKAFFQAIALTIFVTLGVYIIDQIGKNKHKNIRSSKLFQQLVSLGFEVEEQIDYFGLIGERNNLAFRIYYDWNKLSKGFFSFGDIVIIAYYEPVITNLEEGLVDEELLNSLNDKYGFNSRANKRIFSQFTPAYFMRHLNYYPYKGVEAIVNELDKISDLINESGLKIIDKEALLIRQREFDYIDAPPIDLFRIEGMD